MSKEAWFRQFKRVRAEMPHLTDEQAADVAWDDVREMVEAEADNRRKARREGEV